MNKHQPPTAFGVFKPTGYTLIAFRTQSELRAAGQSLANIGFAATELVEYSADEMLQQSSAEIRNAGFMASFGYELDLLRMHHGLAEQGCSFLVVRAPSTARASQVADLVRQTRPAAAQHYGRFLIEDLTEVAPGQTALM
jgi:hypothetical protein